VIFYDLQDDKDFIESVAAQLRQHSHEVKLDYQLIDLKADYDESLRAGLRNLDIAVVVIPNKGSIDSTLLGDIATVVAYSEEAGNPFIVAVCEDDERLPHQLSRRPRVSASRSNVAKIAEELNTFIAASIGRFAARKERAAEFAAKVEENSAAYVEEAIQSQRQGQVRNWISGTLWYAIGFLSLLAGVAVVLIELYFFSEIPPELTISQAVVSGTRTLVVVGLLSACAKYAFTLGKSYINESLKNADRVHAISLGKFYLRAFGGEATWADLKEVFQNWNIDRASTFASLDASQFDPKLVDSVVEVLKASVARLSKEQPARIDHPPKS
jgi:hypothetical protein